MSITHINYIEKQQAVQITIRVFLDDLQVELNSFQNTDIEIDTDREPKNIDVMFQSYLKEKFHININNIATPFEYIGKKYDSDMTVFYIEIPNVTNVQQITIDNKILIDNFSDQENIVRTNINNIKKSNILTKNNTKAFIKY